MAGSLDCNAAFSIQVLCFARRYVKSQRNFIHADVLSLLILCFLIWPRTNCLKEVSFQCGQLAMLGVGSLPHRKTFSFHEPEAPGGVRFKILNLRRLWHLEGFQTELECGNSSERVSLFQDRILELIFKLGPVGNTAMEGFRDFLVWCRTSSCFLNSRTSF